MKERRKQERRRWGRKVTYPFIDSEGVLVTKNRRRKIDRRDDDSEEYEAAQEEAPQAAVAAESKQENKNTSLDISESKVMELEEALQDEDKPASGIMASIKDLENEILDATNLDAISRDDFDAASNKDAPAKKRSTKPKEVEKPAELPEIDVAVNGTSNGKEKGMAIELLIKSKKHVLTTDKDTCQVGRDPSCDIIIQNKFVSRVHAKIMLKDGKIFVEDNSFNGTYVEFNNGQKIHVSKNELTLATSGLMSMGKPVDDKSKSVIEFKISQ
jgi:pSer/pThr/pTyr-binding forkhead associated (FHA) protein